MGRQNRKADTELKQGKRQRGKGKRQREKDKRKKIKDKREKIKDKSGHRVAAPKAGKYKVRIEFHYEGNTGEVELLGIKV